MDRETKKYILEKIERVLSRGGRAEIVRIKDEIKVFEIKRREEK